jgi:hypothetical protein
MKANSRNRGTGVVLASLLSVTSSLATAQSPQPQVSDADTVDVEIFPKYPVSTRLPLNASGPSDPYPIPFSGVIANIRMKTCSPYASPRFEVGDVMVAPNGNRIDVSNVRFGFNPACGFTGDVEKHLTYSVWLGYPRPGSYEAVFAGIPGDAPGADRTASTVTTIKREFVVLTVDQAGKAFIENPAQGSVQSGIGLISGWACVADRVEISIDGGARIKVSGEMGRADVKPECGHSTAGFGLLTNFNLLGPGTHSVQVYVKGVAIGGPTRFTVAVPVGEFLRGAKREVTVTDFPSAGKTTTVDWREAEQNFRVKEVR